MRYQAKYSEEEIAKRLGFDSPGHLYGYLQDRNAPDWLAYPPGRQAVGSTGEAARPTEEHRQRQERKARPQPGPAKQLPPPEQAADLFEAMMNYIENNIRSATRANTVLKGKRFETWVRLPPPFEGEEAALEASEDPPDPLWRLIAMYALSATKPQCLAHGRPGHRTSRRWNGS